MKQNKILISACLLGSKVRYDGSSNLIQHKLIRLWQDEGRLISLCPEMAGGLTVPRKPCEIVSSSPLKICSVDGEDFTASFVQGAHQAVKLVEQHNIGIAILKESSPSCGSHTRYDGSFSKRKIAGEGVTAQYLRNIGVKVFNERQCDEVLKII